MAKVATEIVIWDAFVRFFHWSVASLFLLNFWVFADDDLLHEWAGYLIMALVTARVVWGVMGSTHARFTDFFPTVSISIFIPNFFLI